LEFAVVARVSAAEPLVLKGHCAEVAWMAAAVRAEHCGEVTGSRVN